MFACLVSLRAEFVVASVLLGGLRTGSLIPFTAPHTIPQALWAFGNRTIKSPFGATQYLPFGRSRSSPTIDGDGNLYGAPPPTPAVYNA